MTATLLVEIGLEELPPATMRPLAEAFAAQLGAQLDSAGLAHGVVETYATPRRFAVRIADTAVEGAAEAIEKFGPTLAIAYGSDGQPSKAAEGFARSFGVSVADLDTEDSDKGPRLVYRAVRPGQTLAAVLQPAVDAALRQLPIAKRMRWGHSSQAFVRPVHWVVAMHGTQPLELTVFDIAAGHTTRGHRFHHPEPIALREADDYLARLEAPGHVIADMSARQAVIEKEIDIAAASLGGHALIDPTLVAEVLALVEWPVGIAGRFNTRYLELPREVLIATLEGHQRYFPVVDDKGALIAGFVTLANLQSRDPAQIVAGNERVVDPRLSDALFFWNADRRQPLASRAAALADVSFQQSLGSIADKSERTAAIAAQLAEPAGAKPEQVARAVALAKADLVTEMVGEFPELQGIMGSYYARHDGEDDAVAAALAEQYAPVGAGAPIAASPTGRAVVLADRIDTLAGIFAIDKRPTGDKDPFGLRRAAIGLLRTLIEGDIRIDLAETLATAIAAQPVSAPTGTKDALWQFVMERYRGYALERGYANTEFDAVAAMGVGDIVDFDRRLIAIADFATQDAALVVGSAHKRIRNILRRNSDAEIADNVDTARLVEPAEIDLDESLGRIRADVTAAAEQGDYAAALAGLAPLADPLDRFFSDVMVMADDEALRANRLALLSEIDALCRQVADISCLSVETAA